MGEWGRVGLPLEMLSGQGGKQTPRYASCVALPASMLIQTLEADRAPEAEQALCGAQKERAELERLRFLRAKAMKKLVKVISLSSLPPATSLGQR